MKRKLLSFLLAVVMLMGLMPAAVFAEETAAASLNGTPYLTLADAIAAVTAGDNEITLLADCTENVTIKQAKGVNITIDGDGKTYTGKMTIYGMNRWMGTDTLTIKNVNFETAKASHDFINAASNSNTYRYPHNVTIENCTFTGSDEQTAVRCIVLRQFHNVTVKNCSAEKVFNLVQNASGGNNLTVENCTIDAYYGINAANCNGTVSISDCTINATKGYYVHVSAGAASAVNLSGIEAVERESYAFKGWYNDYEETDFDLADEFPAKGLLLLAKWDCTHANLDVNIEKLDPTCIEGGYAYRIETCAECGCQVNKVLVEEYEALGHEYDLYGKCQVCDNRALVVMPRLLPVTVKVEEGAKVNTSAKFAIAYGARRTIKITVEEGYEVADIIVNGKSVGAAETYTLKGVTKAQNIVIKTVEVAEEVAE